MRIYIRERSPDTTNYPPKSDGTGCKLTNALKTQPPCEPANLASPSPRQQNPTHTCTPPKPRRAESQVSAQTALRNHATTPHQPRSGNYSPLSPTALYLYARVRIAPLTTVTLLARRRPASLKHTGIRIPVFVHRYPPLCTPKARRQRLSGFERLRQRPEPPRACCSRRRS